MEQKTFFWTHNTIRLNAVSEELRKPLLAAMLIWNSVPCAQFQLVLDSQSENRVSLKNQEQWPYAEQVLAMSVLKHKTTSQILLEAHIEVNQSSRKWSQIDYQNVLAHELGHVLGLEHSEDPRSIMYPIAVLSQEERKLSSEDQEKFCALKTIADPEPTSVQSCTQAGFSGELFLFFLLSFWTACRHSSIWR